MPSRLEVREQFARWQARLDARHACAGRHRDVAEAVASCTVTRRRGPVCKVVFGLHHAGMSAYRLRLSDPSPQRSQDSEEEGLEPSRGPSWNRCVPVSITMSMGPSNLTSYLVYYNGLPFHAMLSVIS